MGDTLRVELKSGETITFENDDWDDYEYCFGMFVVKKCNAWGIRLQHENCSVLYS